jgi:hypothetical protein
MRQLSPGPEDPGPAGSGPRGALGRATARARNIGASVRARSAESLERALDRVFAEPFDVPDVETARRLLSGAEPPPTGVFGRYLEGQALVKIAGQVTKLAGRSKAARAAARVAALPAAMAESGAAGATGAATTAGATAGAAAMSTATSMGAAALAAAAVAATTRATRTARRGLNDLRVLASCLASRARAEGVVLDPGLLRALTLATYVDPRRRADFRLTGSRGGAAVLGRWSRETTVQPSELRRQDDVDAWLHAIDRLDLRVLHEDWQRRT